MSDVIKVGLHLDIEDDLSQFITSIDDVAKEAGNKLSESASKEIQSLKKEANDIRDILKNTIKGKASSDTVSKLGEKVQELSVRTTALEENMKALVDTMSDVDNGKFRSALSGIVSSMQSVQENTVSTLETLKDFKKITTTRMGDKVNFVDTSQTDELEKQVSLLQDLQKSLGKNDTNIKLTAKSNISKTVGELNKVSEEIFQLEERLEELGNPENLNVANGKTYDNTLKKLVEARNKFNGFYEEAVGQTTKNGILVANAIKNQFKAEYDNYKEGYQNIVNLIQGRINIINQERSKLGSQSALQYNEKDTSFNIPLYISTRQTTLYKEATTLIENVQNKIDAGDQAIRVNFILKSPYSSKDTNKLLDDFGIQINKLEDGELKQDFSNLYNKLTEDFKHEIKINITSDIDEEEQKVKDSIDAIKKALTEKIHIYPEIEVNQEQLDRIQANLDEVSKTLTLNIDNIKLNKAAINEMTGNREETPEEISARLEKKKKEKGKNKTKEKIVDLKTINDQLTNILTSLELITGETENVENPLKTIISSIDQLAETIKAAFHMGDSVNLDAMFTNMQQAVSKINGDLRSTPKKINPLVLQLRAIVETYKEYKKLGGEHDLLELGGAENVQRWLKKYHPGEIAKEQPKLYVPEFDIRGEGNDLGNSLGQGYAEGMRDAIPAIEAAAREMVYAAVEAIKTTQDSHSPSKVAMALGEYLGIGYEEGLKRTQDEIEKAVRDLINNGVIKPIDLMAENIEKQLKKPIDNIVNNPIGLKQISAANAENEILRFQYFKNQNQKTNKNAYSLLTTKGQGQILQAQNNLLEEIKSGAIDAEEALSKLESVFQEVSKNYSKKIIKLDKNNLLFSTNELFNTQNEIGKSYDEIINKIQAENEEIKKGNQLFKEREVFLDANNKVVQSTIGEYDKIESLPPPLLQHGKLIHSHPSEENYGGHASIADMINWGEMAKRGIIDDVELLWNNTKTNINFSKMTQEGVDTFVENYSHIIQAIVTHFGEEIEGEPGKYKIPEDISETVNTYIYALTDSIIKPLGGNISSNFDVSKIDSNIFNGLQDLYNQIIELINSNISNDLQEQKFNQIRSDYRKSLDKTPVSNPEPIQETTTALSKEAKQAKETRKEVEKLNEAVTEQPKKKIGLREGFKILQEKYASGKLTDATAVKQYELYQKQGGKRSLADLTKDKEKQVTLQTVYDELIKKEKEKKVVTQKSTEAIKEQTTAISQEGQQVDTTKEKIKELNKEVEKQNKKSKVTAKAPDVNSQVLEQKFDQLKQMYDNNQINDKKAVEQYKKYQVAGGHRELSELAHDEHSLEILQKLYNSIAVEEENVIKNTKEVSSAIQSQTQVVENLGDSAQQTEEHIERIVVSEEEWNRLMQQAHNYEEYPDEEYYEDYIQDTKKAIVTTEELTKSISDISKLKDPLTKNTYKKLFNMSETEDDPNKAIADDILDLNRAFKETGDFSYAKSIKTIVEKSNLPDGIKKSITSSIDRLFNYYTQQLNITFEEATEKAAVEMVTKQLKESDYKKYLKLNKVPGFTDEKTFKYNFNLRKKQLLEEGLAKQLYTKTGKKGQILVNVTDTPERLDIKKLEAENIEPKYQTQRVKLSKKQKERATEFRNMINDSSIHDNYEELIKKRKAQRQKEASKLDEELELIVELSDKYKKLNDEIKTLEEYASGIKNKKSKKYKDVNNLIKTKKKEFQEIDDQLQALSKRNIQSNESSVTSTNERTIGLKKETIELKNNTVEQKANNKAKQEAPKQRQIHRDELFANIKKYVGEFENFDQRSSKKRTALDKIVKNFDAYKKANGEKNISDLTDDSKKIEAITKAYNKLTGGIEKNTKAKKENKAVDKEVERQIVNPAPITRVLGNQLGNAMAERLAPNIQQKANEIAQAQTQASEKVEESVKNTKKAAKGEAQSMDDIQSSAKGAAQSKEDFVKANKDVLDSIISSVNELKNEGKAFENLNKLINNLGNKNADDKLEKVKKGLREIVEILQTPLTGNSLIESLERIAMSGSNLSDIATILKASKKDLASAVSIANNLDGVNVDDILNNKAQEIRNNAIRELERLGGTGSQFMNLKMGTTKDGFIEIIGLIKTANDELQEFTLHTKDGIDMQNVGMSENTAQIAKQMKVYAQVQQYFEKLKNKGKNIVDNPFFNKDADAESQKIWQMLLDYAEKYKNELGEIQNITMQTRQENTGEALLESFSINGTNGHLTVGREGETVASNQELLSVRELVDEIKLLSSNRKEYIALLQKEAEVGLGSDEKTRLLELQTQYENVKDKVKELNQVLGENNKAQNSFTEYENKFAVDFESSFDKFVNKATGRIETAQRTKSNQRTDYLPGFKDQLNEAIIVSTKLKEELAKPFSNQNQNLILQYKKQIEDAVFGLTDLSNVAAKSGDVGKLLAKVSSDINDNTAMGKPLKNQFKALQDQLKRILNDAKNTEDGLTNISKIDLGRLTDQFNILHGELEETDQIGKSFIHSLADAAKSQTTQFLAQYFSFQDIIRYGQEFFNTIRELDYELVDLRKTTTMTSSDLEEFYMNSSNIAKQMGVTTKEIISQAAAWSRLN